MINSRHCASFSFERKVRFNLLLSKPSLPRAISAATLYIYSIAELSATHSSEDEQRILRHMMLARGCATLSMGLKLPKQELSSKAPSMSASANSDLRSVMSMMHMTSDPWGDIMQKFSEGVNELFKATTASMQQLAMGKGRGADDEFKAHNDPQRLLQEAARMFTQAEAHFRERFPQGSPTAALLGSGVAALALAQPSAAFQHFRTAIRENPEGSGAAARVGLAYALYALGHVQQSSRAFQAALSMDRSNVDAMCGLAMLLLASEQNSAAQAGTGAQQDDEALMNAQRLLQQAHSIDPNSAQVLNQLARLAFIRWEPLSAKGAQGGQIKAEAKQYSKVITLSAVPLQGLRPGEVLQLRSEQPDGSKLTTLVMLHRSKPFVAGEPAKVHLADQIGSRAIRDATIARRDVETSLMYAEAARDKTSNAAIRSETYALLGRAAHALGQDLRALAAYKDSCKLANGSEGSAASTGVTMAWLGRARLQLKDENKNISKFFLEQLEAREHNNTDVLKLLGFMNLIKADGLEEQLRTPGACSAADVPTLTEAAAASRKKAKRRLQEAVELSPMDYEALLLLARANQTQEDKFSRTAAVEAYRRAAQVMVKRNQALPLTLCNNWAVLNMRIGDWDSAEKALRTGLMPLLHRLLPPGAPLADARSEEHLQRVLYSPTGITAAFNWAVIKEGRGDSKGAMDMLRNILSAIPTYVDAALRLARLHRDAGEKIVARQWLSRALTITNREESWQEVADAIPTTDIPRVIPEGQSDALPGAPKADDCAVPLTRMAMARAAALCLMGAMAQEDGELESAARWFGQVRDVKYGTAKSQAAATFDPYVAVAEQNIALQRVLGQDEEFSHAGGGGVVQYRYLVANKLDKRERSLEQLSSGFLHAMRMHQSNLFAVNGWGCAMAERGNLKESLRIFASVREASQDVGSAAVNQGHVLCALKDFSSAAQLFKHALKKFYGQIDMDAELQNQADAELDVDDTLVLPEQLPAEADLVAAIKAGTAMEMTNVPPALLASAVSDQRILTRATPVVTQRVLMSLARVYWKSGKHAECARTTRFSLALSRLDPRLWFNLAFILGVWSFSDLEYQRSIVRKSVETVRAAIARLRKCLSILRWLRGAIAQVRSSAEEKWFADMDKSKGDDLTDEETAGLQRLCDSAVSASNVGVSAQVVDMLLQRGEDKLPEAQEIELEAELSAEQFGAQQAVRQKAIEERAARRARELEAKEAEAAARKAEEQANAARLMQVLGARQKEWANRKATAGEAAKLKQKLGKNMASSKARARVAEGSDSWMAEQFDGMPNYDTDDEALLLQRGVTGGTAVAQLLSAEVDAVFSGDAAAAERVLGELQADEAAGSSMSIDQMFLFGGFDVRALAGAQLSALDNVDPEDFGLTDVNGDSLEQEDNDDVNALFEGTAPEADVSASAPAPIGGRKRSGAGALVDSDSDDDLPATQVGDSLSQGLEATQLESQASQGESKKARTGDE